MTQASGATRGVVDGSAETTRHQNRNFPFLVIGALGVVYGDIGTSPIYAFRQALAVGSGQGSPEAEVLGLLSLIVWALTLTVAVKYVFFVTRADNRGEGGTLSLMALARKSFIGAPAWVTALGIVGAALFFGDAMLTPAISVLSAVEGIEIVAPNFDGLVIPLTLAIVIGLFAVQRYGTAKVGVVFGPVTAVWFTVLGLSGLVQIMDNPFVLWALNPVHAVSFLIENSGLAFVVMGAVFLAVTGAEGLYVDMGHFGRRPIVFAWFAMVFPCLLLNYFGQGAFVLSAGIGNVTSPFFEMQPEWARLPFIGLTTIATIIASQAVISGAFSLTRQAVALNLVPRMVVRHTSETESGQIYLPQVNTALMIAVIVMVLAFGSSEALSAAYGVAVSGIMLVTLALLLVVMMRRWRWPRWAIFGFGAVYLLVDGGFFAVNAAKFNDGGWVPLTVALVLSVVMGIWIRGRKRLNERTRRDELPLSLLLDSLEGKKTTTVPGTAIFLTADPDSAPTALLHSLKHYTVLHEHNVILTVKTSPSPRVDDEEKIHFEAYNSLFSKMVVTFGYMETPNLPKALALARKLGWTYEIMSTSFFLSRRTLKLTQKNGPLRNWEDRVFASLAHNASDATAYFHLPTGRVVEIGMQLAY